MLNRTKNYIFKADGCFNNVYDWIGSLNMYPEHFEILDYRGGRMDPDDELTSGTFNMNAVQEPVLMTTTGLSLIHI